MRQFTNNIPLHGERRRRGLSLIMVTVGMVMMCALAAITVDYGRVRLHYSQLQDAADAAALASVYELKTPGWTPVYVGAYYAFGNVDSDDKRRVNFGMDFGEWDATEREFTKRDRFHANSNALKITLTGEVDSFFGGLFAGEETKQMQATAIAMLVDEEDEEIVIPSTANPWLAGMPDGTFANRVRTGSSYEWAASHEGWDVRRDIAGTGKESPTLVAGITITPGEAMEFNSIAGEMNHGKFSSGESSVNYSADGNTSKILYNQHPTNDDGSQVNYKITEEQARTMGEHGKSNIYAPVNSLIGVFLDDSGKPVGSGHDVPDAMDFGSESARNAATIAPDLNQMFFIGDGQDDSGKQQKFVVPEGATRLYLGAMDSYEWNNNGGAFNTTIRRPAQVKLVR